RPRQHRPRSLPSRHEHRVPGAHGRPHHRLAGHGTLTRGEPLTLTPAAIAWIERFRAYLATERRCSPHTVAAYTRDLQSLVSYCERTGLESWAAVDNGHLRSFAARQHARGLGPRSIQRRLSAVRSFYEFLQREAHALRRAQAAGRAPATTAPDDEQNDV